MAIALLMRSDLLILSSLRFCVSGSLEGHTGGGRGAEVSPGCWVALAEVWKVQPEACWPVAAGRMGAQLHRPWLIELTLSTLAASAFSFRFLTSSQLWW